MILREQDLLYFLFCEGFSNRSVRGEFWFQQSQEIEYQIKHGAHSAKTGTIKPHEQLTHKILRLCQSPNLEPLQDSYDGGWRDMRQSYFEFRTPTSVKVVRICEVIDRNELPSLVEQELFQINDAMVRLGNKLLVPA